MARRQEVISLLRLVGTDEISGLILLGVIDAVVRPTVGVGVKILEDACEKVKESS